MSRCWAGLITVLALGFGVSDAGATAFFTGSSNGLSATAEFTISGNAGARQLTIILTNTDSATGAAAPAVPADVLTGIFFNMGTGTFTPESATVKPGDIIQGAYCNVPANCGASQTNVGGEFSYVQSGTTRGISSSGYIDNDASSGNFGGSNLDDPAALDGINFGIVPDLWVASGSTNNKLKKEPLVAGAVTFVLDIPDNVSEADIKNVTFQYGTALSEPHFTGETTGGISTTGRSTVPEPGTLSLLALALSGAAYRMRRRAK
jgi:hypothetical protein